MTLLAAIRRTGTLGRRPLGAALGLTWVALRHGPTLYALVAWQARREPNAVALVDGGVPLTFAGLLGRADGVASALARRVRPGDPVGLLCGNGADFVVTLLACLRLGARTVLMNTTASAAETTRVGQEQHLKVLICDSDWMERLRQHEKQQKTALPLVSTGTLAGTPRSGRTAGRPRAGQLILLTSGSTGPARAVRSRMGLRAAFGMAGAVLDALPLRAGAPTLLPLPLFHGHGLATLGLCLALGAPLHLCRPTAEALWHTLQTQGSEVLVLVPTLLHRLLGAPGWRAAPALRAIVCGSAPLDACLATATLDRFGDVIYNLYGSTETGLISLATPADLRAAPGSVGRVLPGVRVQLRGTAGRVNVGGHDTGDLARLDAAGRLTLLGRADDLLICGGENIFPASLETRIAAHAAVADCAVRGVPCPEFGTGIHAFVVLRPGQTLSAGELREQLRPLLPRMFHPQQITLLDALPRTPTGKLMRAQLPAPP